MTPHISDDGNITIKLNPAEVSDLVSISEDGLPTINKRAVNTTVMVKDREAVVIGGLVRSRKIDKISRIPILGYIPLINWLFSSVEKVTENVEVLIIIIPTILAG